MSRRFEMMANRTIYDSLFPVRKVTFRHTKVDGTMSRSSNRVVMQVGEVASGLILKPAERRVVLIEQFRCPVMRDDSGWFVEVVGGLVDPGETPEQALRREVLEEIGYEIVNVRPIHRFYPAPGTIVEHVTLFVGEAARQAGPGGGADADEDIRVLDWTYEQFFEAFDSGRIIDAKAVIAAHWLRQYVL